MTADLRGLSVVDEGVVWASGAAGTWLRSADGGASWTSGTVPGAEELDFRDVQAFSAARAILMSAGPGAASRLYGTEDGGRSWRLLLQNEAPQGFYDGLAFWNESAGLLVGDPVDGRLVVLRSEDGGATWSPAAQAPAVAAGEYAFAASGTALAVAAGGRAWIASGGSAARVYWSDDFGRSWSSAATPLAAGAPSRGGFSVAFRDAEHGFLAGGDYAAPEAAAANAARSDDGGRSWRLLAARPPGYRSAVAWIPGSEPPAWLVVGSGGSDLSLDDGRSWSSLGPMGFHAVAFAPSGRAGFAAGADGRIAKLSPR